MMHYLEIPRCREYDAGQIKVVAKNSEGEEEAITSLTIMPKEDWRSKLKQAPKGKKKYAESVFLLLNIIK